MKNKNWAIVAVALALAACGGGAEEVGDLGEDVFGDVGQAADDFESGDQGSSGRTEVGPVTQTADPGTGWVEVDGQRFDFAAFGSIHHNCEVADDRITINFQQTTSGNDFLLQGAALDGQWNANITFAPMSDDTAVSYGATVGYDAGTLGIGDDAISYEGTLSRVEDYDIANAQDVEGKLAINCAAPGGGTTAEIEGQSFVFPLSGAQGLSCELSDEKVEVSIDHNHPEYLRLQIDVRQDGGQLIGGAHITSGDDNYDSVITGDGEGLTIDGSNLTYEGTFTTPSGEEAEGSVSVFCK